LAHGGSSRAPAAASAAAFFATCCNMEDISSTCAVAGWWCLCWGSHAAERTSSLQLCAPRCEAGRRRSSQSAASLLTTARLYSASSRRCYRFSRSTRAAGRRRQTEPALCLTVPDLRRISNLWVTYSHTHVCSELNMYEAKRVKLTTVSNCLGGSERCRWERHAGRSAKADDPKAPASLQPAVAN
jgi:hypothetical protein